MTAAALCIAVDARTYISDMSYNTSGLPGGLSEDASKLFRVRKTIVKMLSKRNYAVDDFDLEMTTEQVGLSSLTAAIYLSIYMSIYMSINRAYTLIGWLNGWELRPHRTNQPTNNLTNASPLSRPSATVQFAEKYGADPSRESLTILVENPYDTSDQLFVFFPVDEKVPS